MKRLIVALMMVVMMASTAYGATDGKGIIREPDTISVGYVSDEYLQEISGDKKIKVGKVYERDFYGETIEYVRLDKDPRRTMICVYH